MIIKWVMQLWHQLVQVDLPYKSLGEKRRTELMRATLLTFFIFTAIGISFTRDIVQQGLLISLVLQLIAYLLSRNTLPITTILSVLAVSLPQYYPVLASPELSSVQVKNSTLWMLLPLLLTSIWLRPRYYLLFSGIHLSALTLAYLYVQDLKNADFGMLFNITLIACSITWVATLVRNKELKILDRESNQLREQKEMLATIQNNIQEAIAVVNTQGEILTHNHAFEEIFGLRKEEVSDHYISDLIYPPPDSETAYLVLEERMALVNGIAYTPISCSISRANILGQQCSIYVIRDVRIQKEYEAHLIAEKNKAQQDSYAKSVFLSSMSHEFRTPLNAILGFVQLMQLDKHAFGSEQMRSLEEIRNAGEHLLELVNTMLDLASIEAGKMQIDTENIDIRQALSEVYSMSQILAGKNSIKLELGSIPEVKVIANRLRLRQILLNLVSNAIKYNSPQGTVFIACRQNRDCVRVNISDTGAGLTEKELGNLFQPFYRLDSNSKNVEGLGLGLAICKKLAEVMGGSVGASSEPGVGSVFWVELRMAENIENISSKTA